MRRLTPAGRWNGLGEPLIHLYPTMTKGANMIRFLDSFIYAVADRFRRLPESLQCAIGFTMICAVIALSGVIETM